MKKFMCLMLALSIVMMTMVFVPMSASAKSVFYAFDDFDASDELDTSKWTANKISNTNYFDIVNNSTFDSTSTGNSAKMAGVEYNRLYAKFENVTTGVIDVSFDIFIPSDYGNKQVHLQLIDKSDNRIQVARTDGTNWTCAGRAEKNWGNWAHAGDMTKGTWHSIGYKFNVGTKEVTHSIAVKNGKSWTKSDKYIDDSTASTATLLSNISGVEITGMNTDKPVYIDNLKVAHEDYQFPISDNFDGNTKINTTTWNSVRYPDVDRGSSIVSGSSYGVTGNVLKLGNATYNNFGFKPATALTNCILNVKFDVYLPSSNDNWDDEVKIYADNRDECGLLYIQGGALLRLNGDDVANLTMDAWNTVNYMVNLNSGAVTVQATLGDISKTVVTKSDTYTNTAILSHLESVENIQIARMYSGGDVLLDNISINKYPVIAGVEFVKYDDTTSTGLTNVPAGTKEVKVAFSGNMTGKTLNKDTVKLVNTKTNVAVDYTGSLSADGLTWTIPVADYFDATTTYQIVMNADVMSFTTDAGEYKVTSIAAYKGDEEVDEWADITEDTTITVKANVINTTGVDKTLLLICAGYNGDEVKACAVSNTKAVTKDQKNITVENITLTVDKDDMTMVKLFGWDNTLDYLTTGVNVID